VEYGQVIKEALRIVVRNRFLWFFGFFAGTPGFNLSAQWSDDGSPHVSAGVVAAIVVAGVAVVALAVTLSSLAQGALADSVAAIHRGEQRGFRTAWRAGRASFWRVLGVAALALLVLLGALLAVALPIGAVLVVAFAVLHVTAVRVIAVAGALLVGFPVLLVLFTAFTGVLQLGARAAVLDGTPPMASLRAGWRLARTNPLPTFLLLLIQQGIAVGAAIVSVFAVVLLAVPVIVLFVAAGTTAGAIGLGVVVLVAVPAVFAAFGAVGAFGHALWTLGYLRLTGQDPLKAR
jgi:hypothetical protein